MRTTRILLAEDDQDDQFLFTGFLEDRSDIAIMPIAENGLDLFTILEKVQNEAQLPHLILLDQNMPKRNGLQTLQLLKKTHPYAGIPVFVYSTYMDEKLEAECLGNGARRVFTKPIDKNGYHRLIDVLLKHL
jgi:CheY-like chemotaxis protein